MAFMFLKIRLVEPGWVSTDGRIHHFDEAAAKEPEGEWKSGHHPGWVLYGGFRKISARSMRITAESIVNEERDVCWIENFHKGDDVELRVLKIAAAEKIGEECLVFLVNTEVFVINEHGDTMEKLW